MEDKKTFAGKYPIRVGDINYGGHMGNDKSLLLFHDARIHFLEGLGFSESNIGGPGIIMAEAHVFFRREVFRGDELSAYIHIRDIRELSFVMHYTFLRDDEEVLRGNTKLIAYDYERGRVTKLPEEFVAKIV